jgi:FkbM family methyltransferase
MSKTVSSLIVGIAKLLTLPMNSNRRMNTLYRAAEELTQHYSMPVPDGTIAFESTTARSLHDAHSIKHGEPEMVRWLDSLPEGSVLWDIGANIGVYSLYAAIVRNLGVLAFEPGGANHAALCKNIEINNLDEFIQPFCLAFADQTLIDTLYLANTGAGHSSHFFGAGPDPTQKRPHRQSVTGYSIDNFCDIFNPKTPDHLKIDVDGLELAILKGARNTLKEHVKSIIVEIERDEDRANSDDIFHLLEELGFKERKSDELSLRNTIFDK